MKQFKGGLYANLGNYKSSLPQTKILNNFFKQNPVGYKKGGEVKGIKGVNYSRIPVTGGFMERSAVTGKEEFRLLGYSRDPRVIVSQSFPLDLQINGMIVEVAF